LIKINIIKNNKIKNFSIIQTTVDNKQKMLIQNNNNIIRIESNCIIINDISLKKPKNLKGHNITQINDKIYIDGYELIDNQFKRT